MFISKCFLHLVSLDAYYMCYLFVVIYRAVFRVLTNTFLFYRSGVHYRPSEASKKSRGDDTRKDVGLVSKQPCVMLWFVLLYTPLQQLNKGEHFNDRILF